MGEGAVRRVVVVIPACNEEHSVGAAVEAVRIAATRVPVSVLVDTVVVANGCSDATASVARAAGAHVLVGPVPNVGAARALGCEWALRRAGGARDLWIATTDADSVVPDGWLARHVAAADLGADVVLGTVTLDPRDLVRHQAWLREYLTAEGAGQGHGHVHGANLGVRATSYVEVGGFHELRVHEDEDLVGRLLAVGAVPAWVDDVPVTTSARHESRVVGGVGSDLAASVTPSIVA